MKKILITLSITFSMNVFADSSPCLKAAREEVYSRLSEVEEDSDCKVKLSKIHQSNDEVSYNASISCVTDGGFFEIQDLIVLKYEMLSSGKYNCTVQ